jgi:hypothetical protein
MPSASNVPPPPNKSFLVTGHFELSVSDGAPFQHPIATCRFLRLPLAAAKSTGLELKFQIGAIDNKVCQHEFRIQMRLAS